MAQECKVTEGASDQDMSLLVLKKPMVSKEGKCLYACIMEQLGAFADGKMVKSEFMEFAKVMVQGNAKALEKVRVIADGCENVTDADRCEAASKVRACVKAETSKAKIDLGI
jgi:hypothetical protein